MKYVSKVLFALLLLLSFSSVLSADQSWGDCETEKINNQITKILY